MRSIPSILIATFVLFGSAAIAQVGSAFTPSVSTSLATVSVAPSPATVPYGRTLQFTATVAGTTNTGVHWAVNGDNGGNKKVGTISGAGLYKAPTQGDNPITASVTVAAMSNADPTKSAEATVTFTTGVSVAITPSGASVQIAGTQQFSASVTGSSNTAVAWTVNGAAGGNLTVGTISGSGLYTAPAAVPAGTITVKASSAADSSKSAQASVTVLPLVSISLTPTTASVPVGQTQLFAATVTGSSNTAVTWTVNGITGGNSILGTISSSGLYSAPSVATVPASTLTVTATTAVDPTKSAQALVTVLMSPVVIATASLPNGTVGLSYSATITATGGVGPYTWSILSGLLPSGVSLSTTSGIISGLPSAAGSYNMTVQATDSSGQQSSKSLNIVIAAALAVTTATLPGGSIGVAYSATLLATGGSPPYTWSLASGQLPPGMSLTSSGTISGTTSTAGSYSFMAQVTDAAAHQASKSLIFSVSGMPMIITLSIPNGTTEVAYNATLAAVGGTAPYTWSITSGQLPTGVTLATTGVVSGTPTVSGIYTVIAQVVDSSGAMVSQSYNFTIARSALSTDQYGGLTSLPSPNPATGNWRTEKIGSQWWFIDPLNNAYHFVAPYNVGTGGAISQSLLFAKYGISAMEHYLPSVIGRLKAWNYTGIGGGSMTFAWPFNKNVVEWPYDSVVGGNYTPQQYRMPTLLYYPTSTYAMSNTIQSFFVANPSALTQPVKNFNFGLNSYIGTGGYLPSSGEADFYDSRLYSYFDYLTTDYQASQLYWAAPAALRSYAVGALIDEADQMWSFVTGGDNPATLSGIEHSHGGLRAIRTSPLQTANHERSAIYPDSKVYLKGTGFRSYIKNKYANIAALNAAWGSTYSACDMEGAGDQFGSCGTHIIGEAFATGDGISSTYRHTLAQTVPSWHSIAIYVAGALVAGDLGYNAWDYNSPLYAAPGNPPIGPSQFYGPLVNRSSTSMNYTTGAATIVFATGSAAIAKVHGDGTTITVQTQTQHGAWPGAHLNISGTANYNLSSSTIVSVVDSYTFTLSSNNTGAAETSGTASFTDTAPPAGTAITVSYVKNGWGMGNGLMDEDGRHSNCLGASNDNQNAIDLHLCSGGSFAAPTVASDLEGFLGAMATQYFSNMSTVFGNRFGNGSSRKVLMFGPDPLIYWSSPSHAGVLQAAGQYMDVLGVQSYCSPLYCNAGNNVMTQIKLDWIRQNAGDKPLLNTDFILANPDSAMRVFSGNTGFSNFTAQSARGTNYVNLMQSLTSLAYTNGGSKPYVGTQFWQWTDSLGEQSNYGLVTPSDNAYDGHEDATGNVACSAPNQSYTCGSEQYNSGDFIASVKAANSLWVGVVLPLSVTTLSLPNTIQTAAYSQPLSASGGKLPYTWTIKSGALPSGMSLSSAGIISGGATGTGTANFTLLLTDATNAAVTQALSIIVSAAPTSVSDNFDTYPNFTYLGSPNWTATGSTGILVNSQSVLPMCTGNCGVYWSGAAMFANDQYAELEIITAGYIGPSVRADKASNSYYACIAKSGGELALLEVASGTTVSTHSYTGASNNGTTVRITVTGTSVSCLVNGISVIGPVTLTSRSTGKPGIAGTDGDASVTADNWAAGNN